MEVEYFAETADGRHLCQVRMDVLDQYKTRFFSLVRPNMAENWVWFDLDRHDPASGELVLVDLPGEGVAVRYFWITKGGHQILATEAPHSDIPAAGIQIKGVVFQNDYIPAIITSFEEAQQRLEDWYAEGHARPESRVRKSVAV